MKPIIFEIRLVKLFVSETQTYYYNAQFALCTGVLLPALAMI